MNKLHRNLWLLLTVVVAVCVVIFSLSYIALEPWRILPDIGGDGAKNNFTYLYHSTMGSGYWFGGMNYPYGEHIVFTDGMPLLSVLFASIGNVSVPAALTVLWLLVSASVVLSIVFISRILLQFHVPPLSAIVFACLSGIFAPQLQRIMGHYALSYACFVPMVFYWTLMYHRTGAVRYALWLYIVGALFAFLHPYYAAVLLVWAGAYVLGYFSLFRLPFVQKVKHVGVLLIAVVGVFVTIALTMRLTDPIKDRPVTPYTTSGSNTHLKHIFTSSFSPIWQFVEQTGVIEKLQQGGEGYTYPGLVAIFAVLFCWVWAAKRKRSKKEVASVIYPLGFEPIWLFMAAIILLFAMGVPFIWNMMWLMDYLSFFKQFRAMGRFSWMFYYVITIYGVVLLHVLWRQLMSRGKVVLAHSMLVLCTLIWTVEVSGYVKHTRSISREAAYNYDYMISKNELNWKDYLKEHKYSGADFQAVLMLKYYHIGSEKLWVGNGAWSNTLATKAALQLHIPVVNVMMSRTSWELTKKQVKTVAGPFADKPLLRDIPNRKPFLLLHFVREDMDPDQKYLLQASDYIGDFSDCHVYACYPDRIVANDKQYADSVAAILPYMKEGADTCIGGGFWYAEHYDWGSSKNKFIGAGADVHISGQDTNLFTIPFSGIADSQLYEISAWFLLGDKDPSSPYMTVYMLDSNNERLSYVDVLTKESLDNKDMWFRSSVYFAIPPGCKQINCKVFNPTHPFLSYHAMDELLLRPANSIIISKNKNGQVTANNHLYKPATK